jgi:SAM-dependent methyltransferase
LLSLDAKLKNSDVSNVSLVGFDLFPVHFPASANLPSNMKLEVLDAFAENVPDEHVGQYDVVHVRVFTGVVKNNDPAPLLRNALKMLKPGGYLQWDEFNGGSWKAVVPGDDPQGSSVPISATTEMLQTALESGRKAMNLDYTWIENLGKIFQEYGFEEVEHEKMDVKKELRKTMTDSLLMTLHHVSRIAVRNGCMVGTDKNWEQLWTKAGEEIEQGVSLTMDMSVTVGRKPL